MRKQKLINTLLLIGCMSLFFASCKKESRDPNADQQIVSVSTTVSSWLDSRKMGLKKTSQVSNITTNAVSKNDKYAAKNANIDLLKQNLDYSSAYKVSHSKNVDLLIIPINESIKSQKHVADIVSLNLVITMNKQGQVFDGNIIEFYPREGKKRSFSPVTIANIMSNKKANDSGTFKILSVTGRLLRQFEYAKSKINSSSEVRAKSRTTGTTRATADENCTDWYLVTTTYLNDIVVDVSEVYVGTTCDGCDGALYESLCPDEGAGGGGGGGDSNQTIHYTEDYEDSNSEATDDEEGMSGASGPSTGVGTYAIIPYFHRAEVDFSLTSFGLITIDDVRIDPTTLLEYSSSFIDSYGYNGTRGVSLYNHTNSYTAWVLPVITIRWKCDVVGVYRTSDSRTWTRGWTHEYSKTI